MSLRYRLLVVVTFGVYLIALCLIVFWPTRVDRDLSNELSGFIQWLRGIGLPWMSYGKIEWVSNIVLFVPFGVLLTELLGVRRWWLAILLGIAASGGIELAQGLFLSGRTASLRDVLANSIGTVLGALLTIAVAAVRTRRARRTRALASAQPA